MTLSEMLKEEIPKGRFWNKALTLVEGCSPVSPGCGNAKNGGGCWLAGLYRRNLPGMAKGLIDPETRHFNGKVIYRGDRSLIPQKTRKPTVFAVWSDIFHPSLTPVAMHDAYQTFCGSPRHHFILVTKRPEVAVQYIQSNFFGFKFPLSNVTILVTMEDQKRANERMLDAVRLAVAGWRVGILAEPLLGPIDLSLIGTVPKDIFSGYTLVGNWISWILCGGESGPGARPAHPEWVRSLRDQALSAGIPFTFKAWGEWLPGEKTSTSGTGYHRCDNGAIYATTGNPERQNFGTHPDRYSGDMITCCVGKKKSGRMLDGLYHNGVPEVDHG